MADSQNEPLGDRYRLRTRIGSGGMAVVWLARDERLRRDVAVKVLSDAMAADPGYRKRFEREARIAAGVSHPNLVKVFDYGSGEERPYLVMEYVQGETLAQRLERGGLSPSETELLATELLGALAAIHAAGVVHRDVKPSNILLDRDDHAHLTDFGIARMGEATDLTQSGHVMGTLRYMAPEVREGEVATPRSDLYSCGVVLEECLPTGSSSWVADLASRLLVQDPDRRPPSAEAALEKGVPAPTAAMAADGSDGPTTEVLPRRRLGRKAAVVAALGLAAVGAILAIGLTSGGGGSPQAEPGGATHPPAARTTTVTQTTTASTPVTTAPTTSTASTSTPAGVAPPPGSSTADPCAQLDAEKHALDERKHAIDERLKDNKAAKDAAHARLDTQKHALDERIKSCKEAAHP